MRENILELLKGSSKPLSIDQIKDMLEIKSVDELKTLIEELTNLENQLYLYRTKKDKYMVFEDSHLKRGRLSVYKKGFGFVIMEDKPDIRVDVSNMNGAIHNDLVIVEMINDREGKIIRVVNREIGQLVGEYYIKDDVGHIKLDNQRYKLDVLVDIKNSKGAVEGHKVLVQIDNEQRTGKCWGEVTKILGHKNDPGIDIKSIVHEHGFNDTFSDEVLAEAEKFPSSVSNADILGRIDLRDEPIFTIDGDDAKDLDDAVSIKKLENGNYSLGVHIADVSYYVKEHSVIDNEAYDRGTSVYLVDRVIPMLPHKLSNEICSLNEKVDRLTITCQMEIDNEGKIVNHDIYESVINSKKRMTYKEVNQILEKQEVVEGYEVFIPFLKEMYDLSNILRKNKEKRGYLDFNIDEAKVIVDNEGIPIEIKTRERGLGEKIIEDFMIVANETVATNVYWMELPFVYRIHEYPKEDKIKSFLEFISILGHKIKGKPKTFHPKAMQGILEYLKDKSEFPILSTLLLRSMQKAMYRPDNIGHYGLASKCYTHFTSPIRRYPDTTVHRLLRTYLFNKQIEQNTKEYWEKKLIPLCEHSSLKEKNAIECERAVVSLKMAEYMEQHVGEKYEGMISSVMNFGMFVQLANLIEGLVHIADLDEYYYFDERTLSLTGRKSNNKYRIGDKVLVQVEKASKEERTIDFKVLEKIKK
jgi:ribonuclease R